MEAKKICFSCLILSAFILFIIKLEVLKVTLLDLGTFPLAVGINEGHKFKEIDRILTGDTELCLSYQETFGVLVGKSWGSMPKVTQEEWKKLNCDFKVAEINNLKATSSHSLEDLRACTLIKSRYNIKAAEDIDSNPVISEHIKMLWKQKNCMDVMTTDKSHTVRETCDNSTTIPQETIALVFGVTTRGVTIGEGDSFERNLAAFDILLPSFVTTVECGYKYLVCMAYDIGDAFYDSAEGQNKVKQWFSLHVEEPLADNNIIAELVMVEVNNEQKKPGFAFTAATKAAFQRGADWFYRLNDDTDLLEPWATKFIASLKALGPPYGVVGPKCVQCNNKILVHDFTHRTHMEIFNELYYPPQLSDWWMDDWISRVYGYHRTIQLDAVKAMHHDNKHGQRYQVDRSHERYLAGLVKEGHSRVCKYMEEKNLGAEVVNSCHTDRTNGAPYKQNI